MNKKLILSFIWVLALNIKTAEYKPKPLTGLGQKIQEYEEYVKAICKFHNINFINIKRKEPEGCPLIEKMVLQKSIIEKYDKIKANYEKIKNQQETQIQQLDNQLQQSEQNKNLVIQQQQQINILNHQVQQSKQDQATIQQQQQQINTLNNQLQELEKNKNLVIQQQQQALQIQQLQDQLQQSEQKYNNLKNGINKTFNIIGFQQPFKNDNDIIDATQKVFALFTNINNEIQTSLKLQDPIYFFNAEKTTIEALNSHFKELQILKQQLDFAKKELGLLNKASKAYDEKIKEQNNKIQTLQEQKQGDVNTINKMNLEIESLKTQLQTTAAELNQIKLQKNIINNQSFQNNNNNNNNIIFQQEKQSPYTSINFLFKNYIIEIKDNPLDFNVNKEQITKELGGEKKKFLYEIVNYFVSKNINFNFNDFLKTNNIQSNFTNILLENKDQIKQEYKELTSTKNQPQGAILFKQINNPNAHFMHKLKEIITTK